MRRWAIYFSPLIFCLLSVGGARGSATTMPTAWPSDSDFSEPSIAGLGAAKPLSDEAPELLLYNDMPIVVAAGKREQTQREAPASVSVVTADDIELFGYRSLADVLRAQRGFYLSTDGLNWFAGVRGFLLPDEWNARLLVLVDGRPTREIIYNQTHLDEDFVVPMEAIKQIEIVRGPGSALYGADAVFAVINVVTKDGADVNGAQVKLSGGTQATGRIDALIGFKTESDWDLLGNLSGYTSQGDDHIHFDGINDADHNFGNIVDSDYEGVYSGFFKAKKGEFTATVDFESRQKDNSDATYLPSWYDPGSMHEDRGNFTLKFDHEVTQGQTLHVMAYYGQYSYNQHWQVDNGVGGPLQFYTTTASDKWFGEEINYDWQVNKRLHLLAGVESTQAITAHQEDYETGDGIVLDTNQSYSDYGIFAEAEEKLTPWLDLTAGGRLDQVQRIGQSISPRFAAVITPDSKDTFKAMYGRSFDRPNLYELFYSSPGSNTPNPNLQSEICDTYELEWERENKEGWRTILDAYVWRLSDAIDNVQLPDGSEQSQNVGTDWAHGLEGEVDKKWDTGATLRVYGSVSSAQRNSDDLTHSPVWSAGTSLAIPIFNRRTFLSVEPVFVGSQFSDSGQKTQPTYITNVFVTSKEFVRNVDLQFGFYNLFANYARLPRGNQFDQYEQTIPYPSPEFLASVTYRF
jgi:outer membrane receptor for ferrienterochelin and colicins